ncbi:MAG: hypothetical protein J6A01_02260 [Proteobacteria bacterium]|nr:hypothetical protein [Pseudomonadota bacterium]
MNHHLHKIVSYGYAFGLAGLFALLLPISAYAERPEIDCGTLSEKDMQTFYDLSGKCADAAGEKNYSEALSMCQKAMKMCTSDVYTEYTLGRVYQLTEDIANACYHYDILMNRPADIQKENADIYKELKKNMKTLKAKCSEFGKLEITCKMKDVELAITGLTSMTNFKCPFYGNVQPGSYPITAVKDGFQPRKETANVSAESTATIVIPDLQTIEYAGFLRVKCPKGSSKFILTHSDGKVEEYVCPWEGEVPADTYKIRLGGADASEDVTVVVAQKGREEYTIPTPQKSSCSAAPNSTSSSTAGGIFALLSALGLAVTRRRRAQ